MPGAIIWIRNQRWRIDRARQDRHIIRLDVSNRQRRLTLLAPFDRPVATTGITRARRMRRQCAIARIAGLLSRSSSALSLQAARDALAKGQSARCLDAVNAYFAAFPNGHLSAEARYLRVEAMFAGSQKQQAAALARGMLVANPRSPYAARLRTIAGDTAP